MNDRDWEAYGEDGESDFDVVGSSGLVSRCGILLAAMTLLVVFCLGHERLFVWRLSLLLPVLLVHLAISLWALVRFFQAVRDEPDEELHLRCGLAATALPAAVALLVLAGLAVSPLRLGFTTVTAVRDMGQGTVLELVHTPFIRQELVLPRLRFKDRELLPGGIYSNLEYLGVSVETRRGFALVRSFRPRNWRSLIELLVIEAVDLDERRLIECTWAAVDRRGRTRSLDVSHLSLFAGAPDGSSRQIDPILMTPSGWSADGKRFAWSWRSWQGLGALVVMDEDLQMRRVDFPKVGSYASFPVVRWIDDQRLLLGTVEVQGLSRGRRMERPSLRRRPRRPQPPIRWTVLSYRGEIVAELGEDPLPWWRQVDRISQAGRIASLRFSDHAMPFPWWRQIDRISQAEWIASPKPPFELSVFNPTNRQWQVWATLDSRPDTLAALEDGRLLWTYRPGSENAFHATVHTASVDAAGTVEIRASCSFEALPRDDKKFYPHTYRGEGGGWAVWSEKVPGRGSIFWSRLLACHLETGEIRVGGPLGTLGSGSVDVIDEGILTPEGLIPFADLEGTPRPAA